MSRARLRSLAPVVVALALIVVESPARAQHQAASKKDDPAQTERRLRETQKQLREERDKAADAKRRETSILAELESVDRRLAQKQRDVARLDQRIRQAQADIESLQGEITRLAGQRTGQEDRLARRLRTMYKLHAQGGALPLILTRDDPVDRAITLRHLSKMAVLDAQLIEEYRMTSDRLGDRRAREEARQADLATLRADARREQLEVDREAAKRRSLLAKVRDERAYHERMVGELTEAANHLEAFLRDLQARQRRLAKVPPPRGGVETPGLGFGTLRGKLPWPASGRIVAAFGAQVHPRFGTRIFRNGVDIEAGEGTDITAVYPGHVVYSGWFKGYGNLIILDHGNDYYTLYAHVADMLVHEGDDVKQAQRIGTVGDTGSLAGARLYFEVRYGSKALDPAEWLRQRG